MTFFRTDDGKEQHYEGSDYASTFQILNNEHVNKVRHLINPDQSFDLHYALDQDGNLITEAIYKNGYISKEFFVRSEIK